MALEERQVDVEFTGGLETRDNRRRVIQGKLLDLENVCFPTADVPHRRPGTEVVSDASTPALALAATERELLRWTANGIDSRAANGTWVQRGDAIDAQPYSFGLRQVMAPSTTTAGCAVGHLSGVTAVAWAERLYDAAATQTPAQSGWVVRLTVLDEATGAKYLSAVRLTGAVESAGPPPIRIVTLATHILVFYIIGGVLWVCPLSPSAVVLPLGVVPSSTQLVTGLIKRTHGAYPYEMDATWDSATTALLTWTTEGAGPYLQRYSVSTGAMMGTPVDLGMAASAYALASVTNPSGFVGFPPMVTVRSEQVTSAYSIRLEVLTASTFRYSLDGGVTWSSSTSMNLLSFQAPFAVELMSGSSQTGVAVAWQSAQTYVAGQVWAADVVYSPAGSVASPDHLHIWSDSAGTPLLAYRNYSGALEVRHLNSSLATTARYVAFAQSLVDVPSVVFACAPRHFTVLRRVNGNVEVYVEPVYAETGEGQPIVRGQLGSGRVLTSLRYWGWGLCLAGHAFNLGGRLLVPAVYVQKYGDQGVGTQPTLFVVDGDSPVLRVAARALDSDTGPVFGTGLPRAYTPAGGGVAIVAPDRGRFALGVSEAGVVTDYTAAGLSRLLLRETSPALLPRLANGAGLHVGGSAPAYYDGSIWTEDGFHVYPEGLSVEGLDAGGAMGPGSYSFLAVYEWSDAQGRRHQSTPSEPVSVVVPPDVTTASARVSVPLLRLTTKPRVRVVLYRTEANGTVYYRTVPASSGVTQPDPSAVSTDSRFAVTITDGLSDAAIRTNEALYRTGGELDHRPPPAYSYIHRHQEYLFVVRMGGGTHFAYSLPVADGEGVAWADELVGSLTTDTGALVGFGTLDDRLVCFTERAEYVVSGQGPDVTGGGNGFSTPQYVTGSVGCSNPRSILRVPAGLLRQTSASEIVLLSRAMEEVTAATGVERYAGLTVVGALDVQTRREARFLTAEGTTLVWCYEGGQWTVWTEQPAVDAVLYGTAPHYLHSSGAIRKDSATSKAEGGATLPMKVGTSWLKYAGIQGAQRVWRFLLLASADCGLTVRCQVYVDYDETTPVDTVESLYPEAGVFQVRHFLRRQQCQALRFVFTFEPEEDVGDVSFNGLSLMLGIQRGLARLPAARTL